MKVTFTARELQEAFDSLDDAQVKEAMGILTADNEETAEQVFDVFAAYLETVCGVGYGAAAFEYEVNDGAVFEPIETEYGGVAYEQYVNMGDTYKGTVLLTANGDLVITSWGDRYGEVLALPGVCGKGSYIPWNDSIDAEGVGFVQLELLDEGCVGVKFRVFLDGVLQWVKTVGRGEDIDEISSKSKPLILEGAMGFVSAALNNLYSTPDGLAGVLAQYATEQ